MEDLYYLQDSRDHVGNDVLFWAKGSSGYTTNIDKAELFTKEQAVSQNKCRETDIPWPKSYIDKKTIPAVDMQYINRNEALQGTGIELKKPEKIKKETYRCYHCGIFMSKRQYYATCNKCGGSNCP